MGRIILAYLPPERVDRLYAGVMLKAVTPHTAITLAQLHAQLDADRAEGLAWSDGNYEAGISSVAAAIFDATDTPIAALNVTGQSNDFDGDARHKLIAANVREAASEISLRLGWRGRANNGSFANDDKEAGEAHAIASGRREPSWTSD